MKYFPANPAAESQIENESNVFLPDAFVDRGHDHRLLQRLVTGGLGVDDHLPGRQCAVQVRQVHANARPVPVVVRAGDDLDRSLPGHLPSLVAFVVDAFPVTLHDPHRLAHLALLLPAAINYLQLPKGRPPALRRLLGHLCRKLFLFTSTNIIAVNLVKTKVFDKLKKTNYSSKESGWCIVIAAFLHCLCWQQAAINMHQPNAIVSALASTVGMVELNLPSQVAVVIK